MLSTVCYKFQKNPIQSVFYKDFLLMSAGADNQSGKTLAFNRNLVSFL